MTIEQFDIGIGQLVREGLVPPYRVAPGSRPGGRVDAICTSWARWRTYDWNPPEFLPTDDRRLQEYGDTDFDASPKPSWREIRDAYDRAAPVRAREQLRETVRAEEGRRICVSYVSDQDVPQTVQNEILYRLRASSEELAPKDLERDRLHAKAAALVTSLDSMALDALEEFRSER